MQDHNQNNGGDVQFNLHVAGGWTGKKKFPDSLQHFSQLKMHRSFDYGAEPNEPMDAKKIKKNTEGDQLTEDLSPVKS